MIPLSITDLTTQRICTAACALAASHIPGVEEIVQMRDCDALVTGDRATWEVAIYLGDQPYLTIAPGPRGIVSVMGRIEALPHAWRIAASLEAEVIARHQQRIVASMDSPQLRSAA